MHVAAKQTPHHLPGRVHADLDVSPPIAEVALPTDEATAQTGFCPLGRQGNAGSRTISSRDGVSGTADNDKQRCPNLTCGSV